MANDWDGQHLLMPHPPWPDAESCDQMGVRCLDHGFEYVEADLLRPTVGHEEREKEGFPRVVESIYSTQWKSMTLLGHKPVSGQTSTTGVRLGEGMRDHDPVLGMPQQQHGGTLVSDDDTARGHSKGDSHTGGSSGGGETWGGEVDDLDMMFDKIREMRSCAMNSGSMSDGERREKAAQLAMHLAKLLGIDDDEDEEDGHGAGGVAGHGQEARRE